MASDGGELCSDILSFLLQYESYREAAATREHLHHHIEWCRQDGDWQAVRYP